MKGVAHALTAALVLVGVANSTLPAAASTDGTSETTHVYLVVLRDAPVASYRGGIGSFAATAPSAGTASTPAPLSPWPTGPTSQTARTTCSPRLGSPTELVLVHHGTGRLRRVTHRRAGQVSRGRPRRSCSCSRTRGSPSTHRARRRSGRCTRTRAERVEPTPRRPSCGTRSGAPSEPAEATVIGVIDTGVWPDNPSLAGLPVGAGATARHTQASPGSVSRGRGGPGPPAAPRSSPPATSCAGSAGRNVATSDYLSPRDGSGHGTERRRDRGGQRGSRHPDRPPGLRPHLGAGSRQRR